MADELEKINENQVTLSKNQAVINDNQMALSKNQAALREDMAEGLTGVQAAVNEQTFAIVASQALLARTFNQGFDQINSTLDMKFARVENALDRISDIMNKPLFTQFRELYGRAVERYRKKQFEEALEDTQAALDKDKTNYAAWFLQGIIYTSGKSKYSDVIDFDKSIDSLNKAAKYIDPEIEGNADARRMAAEIHFSLGNAWYSKSKALSLENKKDESSEMLMKARRSFEESYRCSKAMLESLYNTVRCKLMQGETSGALKDLETLVLSDRNYCIKVYADNDFSSIREQFTNLINKLKNWAFISAKNDYDRINTMIAELKSLGGTTDETIPATFTEDLPYFDVLDYANSFKRIIPIVGKAVTNKKAEIERIKEENARAEQEESERQKLYDSLVQKMNYYSAEENSYALAKQFRQMNGYRDTAKLADECEDNYREYQNRSKQLEEDRIKAKRRKIILGKIFAAIIQIGTFVAFILNYFLGGRGAVPAFGLLHLIVIVVSLFCILIEAGGFKAMILIIVLSVIWFFVSGGINFIGIGSIAAAILAYKSKDLNYEWE
ncbi:hypothetical protein R84B8_00905 [Treponema sp. R8-4-B8]